MYLSTKEKEWFLLPELIVLDKENIQKMEKIFNNIHTNFLKAYGLPAKSNCIRINNRRTTFNGKYDVKHNNIYLFPKSLADNKFQYFHTLIHESVHMIQNFIIKNSISKNNIETLNYEQFQNMCVDFFEVKCEDINIESFNTFKAFFNEEKYFENDKLNLMYKDFITYSDIAFTYNNNVCEIMANDFAIQELNNTFFLHRDKLTQQNISDIDKCVQRNAEKIEKIRPEFKKQSLIIQYLTNLLKNVKLQNYLSKASINTIKVDKKKCMNDIQDSFDTSVLNMKYNLYYSKSENEIDNQKLELFNTIDIHTNFETKNLEENNNHDEH